MVSKHWKWLLAALIIYGSVEAQVVTDSLTAEESAYADSISRINAEAALKAEALSRYNEGTAHFAASRAKEAEASFSAALEILPRLTEAWYNRAIVRASFKRYDEALDDLDSARSKDPLFKGVEETRSEILMEAGRTEEALKVLDGLLKATVSDARIVHRRGTAHFLLGSPEKASQDFSRATTLDPGFAGAWNDLASAYRAMGQPEKAIAPLEQALKVAPGTGYILNNLGSTLRTLDRSEESLQRYIAARTADNNYVPALINQASLLIELDRPNEARPLVDEGMKRFPDQAAVHNLNGILLRKAGKPKEAVKALDEAIRLDPGYATAYLNRAIAREEAGDGAGACADYAKAKNLGLQEANKYYDRECQ
jgi:tetratricopeptide (TPR) repeat protein